MCFPVAAKGLPVTSQLKDYAQKRCILGVLTDFSDGVNFEMTRQGTEFRSGREIFRMGLQQLTRSNCICFRLCRCKEDGRGLLADFY